MVDNNQKFCVHCGAVLDDGAVFCKNCGAKVEEQTTFCVHCGAELEPGSAVCKACGTPVGGVPEQPGNPYASMEVAEANSRLTIVGIFCALYAVIALITGIYILMATDQVLNQLTSDPSWPDVVQQIIDAGHAKDSAEVENIMRSFFSGSGYLSIIIAITSAIPAVTSFTKKGYVIGLIALIVCTILSTSFIIGLIVGIIIIVLYCKAKPAFTS